MLETIRPIQCAPPPPLHDCTPKTLGTLPTFMQYQNAITKSWHPKMAIHPVSGPHTHILNSSHHLLNVLLQLANKLGLNAKKNVVSPNQWVQAPLTPGHCSSPPHHLLLVLFSTIGSNVVIVSRTWGSEGMAPRILNLSFMWSWVVNFHWTRGLAPPELLFTNWGRKSWALATHCPGSCSWCQAKHCKITVVVMHWEVLGSELGCPEWLTLAQWGCSSSAIWQVPEQQSHYVLSLYIAWGPVDLSTTLRKILNEGNLTKIVCHGIVEIEILYWEKHWMSECSCSSDWPVPPMVWCPYHTCSSYSQQM
jgi:hypothetical protein